MTDPGSSAQDRAEASSAGAAGVGALEEFAPLSPERRGVLLQVSKLLDDIDFGTVLLVVQDSKVVQIEMAEKFRLR